MYNEPHSGKKSPCVVYFWQSLPCRVTDITLADRDVVEVFVALKWGLQLGNKQNDQ